MSRRFAVVAGRGRRGVNAGAPPTALAVLGANLLAEWDARFLAVPGATPTWTDTVGGRVLTGVNTPTFGAVAGNFKGRSIFRFSAGSSQYMETGAGGAVMFPIGTGQFYASCVATMSATGSTGAVQNLVSLFDNAMTSNHLQLYWPPAAPPSQFMSMQVGGDAVNLGTIIGDSLVHCFEFYLDAAGRRWLAVDGVDFSDNATTGVTTTVPIERIAVAGYPSGPSLFANWRIARLRICSTVPTTVQRAQLRLGDQFIWGAP